MRKTLLSAALVALVGAVLYLLFAVRGGSEGKPQAAARKTMVAAPARATAGVAAPRPQFADSDAVDPKGPLRLEGLVLDGRDDPISGATVTIDSRPSQSVTTGEDGSFAIEGLIGRTYSITARTETLVGGPMPHALSETSDPAILHLRPGAAIEVRVVRADTGDPVVGAVVATADEDVLVITDDAGGARLANVTPGMNVVTARRDGLVPGRLLVTVPDSPGSSTEARIALEPGVPVSGRVLNPAGEPVAGARVVAARADTVFQFDNPRKHGATTGRDGRFAIDAVPAGSVRLRAVHDDYAPSDSELIDVADELEDVVIRLEPGARIAGVVLGDDGQPARWADVAVYSRDAMDWSSGRHAVADESGRFEVTGLPRETLQVRASNATASSAELELDLKSRPRQDGVEIVLDVAGIIAGRVVDEAGQPVALAEVTATPDWLASGNEGVNVWSSSAFATSDGDGNFWLRGLPEGSFRLHASLGSQPGGSHLRQGTAARTGDSGVRLIVASPGAIVGKLALPDGSAPAVAVVSTGWGSEVPASQGVFRVEGLQPGTYDLRARGPGFADEVVKDVEVEAGETADVGTLELRVGRAITGIVVDSGGAPVEGAEVVVGRQIMSSGSSLQDENFASFMGEQMGIRTTESGSDGRFRISGVGDSRLVIAAEHAERGRAPAQKLARGREDARVELRLETTAGILGRVTQGGKPMQLPVMVSPARGAEQLALVTAGPDGAYRVERVAPGDLRVSVVRGNGFTGNRMISRRVSVAPGAVAEVDIEVPEGEATLLVDIRSSSSEAIGSAQVFVVDTVITGGTMEELEDYLMGQKAGSFTFMSLWTGGEPLEVEDMVPGRYSVCGAPLAGDPGDPRMAQRMMDEADDWQVECAAATLRPGSGAQTVVLELAPVPAS